MGGYSRWMLPALAVLLGGCAGGGGRHDVEDPSAVLVPASLQGSGPLTSEDLTGSAYHDAYSMVRALRPAWLVKRGNSSILLHDDIRVYRDGVFYGGIGSLSNILVESIQQIEHLNGSQATQRFGTNNGSGAIAVWSFGA